MKDQQILIISSEAWGNIFVSKHHYARFLSGQNDVVFLNPPSIPWSLKSLFRIPYQIEQVTDRLAVVSCGNWLPKISRLPLVLQKLSFRIQSKALHKKLKKKRFDLVWSFDLKRFYDLKVWKSHFRLFHAVELIDHPFFVKEAPHRHKVVASADLVVSIAHLISTQARPWNSGILQLNHGIDIQYYDSYPSTELTLPGTNRLKAGFVGNFQVSFDFESLVKVAEGNRSVDFIMVGPTVGSNLGDMNPQIRANIERVRQLNNVHFVGEVPSMDLPQYLVEFDLNLILYKEGYSDGHCNPHKVMSYLYYGKVIVSSFIDEYKNRPELISMVDSNDQLPVLVSDVVSNLEKHNAEDRMKVRRDFARNNDYRFHIAEISNRINMKA